MKFAFSMSIKYTIHPALVVKRMKEEALEGLNITHIYCLWGQLGMLFTCAAYIIWQRWQTASLASLQLWLVIYVKLFTYNLHCYESYKQDRKTRKINSSVAKYIWHMLWSKNTLIISENVISILKLLLLTTIWKQMLPLYD